MSHEQPSVQPAYPDGDSMIAMHNASPQEFLDKVMSTGVDQAGNFTLTDGSVQPDGALTIYADTDGSMLKKSLMERGYPEHFIDAYGDRLALANNSERAKDGQVLEAGMKTILDARDEESGRLLINGTGELGKANVVGYIADTAKGDPIARTYGLFEVNGRLFSVGRRTNVHGHTGYVAEAIDSSSKLELGSGNVMVTRDTTDDLQSASITANRVEAEVYVPPTPGTAPDPANAKKSGILRGFKRGRQNKNAETNEPTDFKDFDSSLAVNAITEFVTDERKIQQDLAEQNRIKEQATIRERLLKAETSISELSAQYPEAGNLFTPGADIYEDQGFQRILHKHGIHIGVKGKEIYPTEDGQKQLRANPHAIQELAQMLSKRLNAWCASDPAQAISYRYMLAPSERNDMPMRVPKPNTDNLIDYNFSQHSNIANTRVPARIKSNGGKSPDTSDVHGHPARMSSREYVVRLAVDMITGAFDYGRDSIETPPRVEIDRKNKIEIITPIVRQHRAAAEMIVRGGVSLY